MYSGFDKTFYYLQAIARTIDVSVLYIVVNSSLFINSYGIKLLYSMWIVKKGCFLEIFKYTLYIILRVCIIKTSEKLKNSQEHVSYAMQL